jgi:hypothetical protein
MHAHATTHMHAPAVMALPTHHGEERTRPGYAYGPFLATHLKPRRTCDVLRFGRFTAPRYGYGICRSDLPELRSTDYSAGTATYGAFGSQRSSQGANTPEHRYKPDPMRTREVRFCGY